MTGGKVLADERGADVRQEPARREWAVAAAAVEPVRAALLGAARAGADRDVAAARRYAAEVLDTATARVSEVHTAAVEAGRVEAAARTARTQAQARRDRRAAELRDQDAAYAQLRARVRAAVRALPGSHPQLRERLVARAMAELGPDARLTDTPDGGLLAETPGQRLDLSLDALADLAVDALGGGEPAVDTVTDTVTDTVGRLRRVNGPLVECTGIGSPAVAELVALGERGVWGEVVAIAGDRVTVQAYEDTGGLAPGNPARALARPLSARLGPGLLGQVFDGLLRPLSNAPVFLDGHGQAAETAGSWWFEGRVRVGQQVQAGAVLGVLRTQGPLEHRVLVPPGVTGAVETVAAAGPCTADATLATVGGTPVRVYEFWPVRRPRPSATRRAAVEPLRTGQRVLDLMFPVALGGSAVVPGGFGTGKTLLLQQVAKWCDADVIVYVGCGERGNEMAEIVAEFAELDDPRTGGRLIDRTVIIANTSNMPMMAREASIYTGVTVAEYFRDMGYAAVVIADSTSRWAEALREFASRSGAVPAEEGYPAELSSALAAFYERSGVVTTAAGTTGSVTLIGAVSPPGGDMTEPVTAYSERFVRCRWTLDRDLAYGRHYPAVSWSGSFSRDLDAIAADHADRGDPDWAARRARVAGLLADADRLGEMAELTGSSALPPRERAVLMGGRLLREAVLQQSALSANDAYCSDAKTAALADVALAVVAAGEEAVRGGLPPDVLEAADLSSLTRIRDETGPDDVDGVRCRGGQLVARVRELRP